MENHTKKLYRSRTNKMIAGVCGGLGEYFDFDPLIFRILFLILIFGGGFGFLIYIILAIIIPNEPINKETNTTPNDPGEFKDKINSIAEQIKQNTQDLAKEIKYSKTTNSIRNFIGIFIVLMGIFFLMENLLPNRFLRWDLFWPIIAIIIGILVITRKK